jgi:hypothetical protein
MQWMKYETTKVPHFPFLQNDDYLRAQVLTASIDIIPRHYHWHDTFINVIPWHYDWYVILLLSLIWYICEKIGNKIMENERILFNEKKAQSKNVKRGKREESEWRSARIRSLGNCTEQKNSKIKEFEQASSKRSSLFRHIKNLFWRN